MSWSIDAGVTATYSGEWKTSLRDGTGWMTWDYAKGKGDEAFYEGEWKKGMRQGLGKMVFPDGDEYKGQWENDMRWGQGKMVWAIGDEYEGATRRGRAPQRTQRFTRLNL